MSQNPNHRFCPECGKLFANAEYAKQCHGQPGTRVRPHITEVKKRTGKPFIPKVIVEQSPPWRELERAAIKAPDPNCPRCALARRFGEVISCECMK